MTTTTSKKPLIHHGYDTSKVSTLTLNARWEDLRTSRWLITTQVWSWKGGDAIVVVTNDRYGRPTNYVVLRVGDQIHFVEGVGVLKAMRNTRLARNKLERIQKPAPKRSRKSKNHA
jgi:hypothetical protein